MYDITFADVERAIARWWLFLISRRCHHDGMEKHD